MSHTTKQDRLLDELASDARTALDDPAGVGLSDPEQLTRHPEQLLFRMRTNHAYAISRLDAIINMLNPVEETSEAYAETLAVLGRHLAERQSKIEQAELTYEDHSPESKEAYETAFDALTRALDAIDEAILALDPEREGS